MSKTIKIVRWTVGQASQEFGRDPKTITSKLKSAGLVPGADGMFSTHDICRALFSDYESEKTRLTKEQADLAELKKLQMSKELCPVRLVDHAWTRAIVDLRQKILNLDYISQQQKNDILRDLQNIPIDEYFENLPDGLNPFEEQAEEAEEPAP